MLEYLKHVDRTIVFKDKFSKIEMEMETEYGSSRTYKDIHILVIMSSNFFIEE